MKKFTTTLALVVAMLSAVSLTAYANEWEGNPYASLVNTTTAVHFNDYDWYIIEDNSTAVDAGTVTLLAAGTDFGNCKFSNDDTKSYNASIVKGIVDDLTENGAFKDVADAIKPCSLTTYEYRSETVAETTENAKLYLLSTEEAKKLSVDVLKIGKEEDMIYWWLRSPGDEDFFQQELFAAMVYGDYGFVYDGGFSVLNELLVRPALQLDLSKVTFDAETNTFSATAAASVATPTFTPAEGEYTSSQSVTISTTTEGAKIYFTVDGTEPTTSSQLYNALMPIDLPAENGTYTIKAIAVKDGMANSEIASATYIINNATGIDETDADAVKSDIWYDLNGRCYQGKPTMPGVYINNGEKIIVQ